MKPTPNSIERKLDSEHFIVSKTDLVGNILYVNRYFIKISGYEEQELIGQPHNIIRHPDMPKVVFKMLWEHLKAGDEFWGYVKNLAKDGAYYWVFAHVTPSTNTITGKITGYHSDRRSADPKKLEKIIPLYQELLHIEQTQSMEKAEAHLMKQLKAKEMTYEDFIFSL